jgi:hypothetical protein
LPNRTRSVPALPNRTRSVPALPNRYAKRLHFASVRTLKRHANRDGFRYIWRLETADEVARILERQKMLQTSQVLFWPLWLNCLALLPFKDSSEAAKLRCATVSATKPPGTSRWSEARPR